jgi:formylglycine-generating enzyme required for sulfatase activity
MKATVLTGCALMLIGVGLGALTTRPDRVAAQEVKIEPGRKTTPKPATPTTTPRKPVVNRMPRRADPEIEMVLIPDGSFLMGSPENEPGRHPNEGPRHRVTVRSFYIGKYEVTQAQWRAVMGGNWYHTAANCRSTNRGSYSLDARIDILGFRLVRTYR